MKRALIVAGVAGLSMFVAMGCEEKKANPLGDAMKQAGDKAKDATAGMADKAKDAASAGLKNLLDTAKTKIDALTKAGESLKADQKPEFAKALSGITDQFGSLSKGFDGLKGMSGDGLMAKVKELTGNGEGLLKTISSTAEKFGLKL